MNSFIPWVQGLVAHFDGFHRSIVVEANHNVDLSVGGVGFAHLHASHSVVGFVDDGFSTHVVDAGGHFFHIEGEVPVNQFAFKSVGIGVVRTNGGEMHVDGGGLANGYVGAVHYHDWVG